MRVYTFFAYVPGKDMQAELALIDLWKRSWSARGWQPTVLNEKSLANSSESREMIRHFRRLPSRNKKNLDLWCFLRWVAVAEQGGGVMSDYDVINYAFSPREAGTLTTYDRWIPCLVSGTREEFLRAVAWFLELRFSWFDQLRGSHSSDMLVLQQHQDAIQMRNECVEFDLPGWETAPAVHFSNRGMKPRGLMPRHEAIPKLRDLAL